MGRPVSSFDMGFSLLKVLELEIRVDTYGEDWYDKENKRNIEEVQQR